MRSVLCFVLLGIWLVTGLATIPAHAQTFTDVHDYHSSSGDPYEFLQTGFIPQGRDGKLYGISHFAGTSDIGTIFVTDPTTGVPTILTSFDNSTGAYPYNGLVLGTDGNFYGDAPIYGTGGAGSVFKVTPAGVLTVLHAFTNTGDSGWPVNPPVQGNDGNWYGIASGNDQGNQFPSVFYKVTSAGVFTALHTFDTNTEGTQCEAIILGSDGNFWGGCNLGGASADGTLFKITPSGAITVLHTLTGTDGLYGGAGMVQAPDGNYYGLTFAGGSADVGVFYKLTPGGVYTVLHHFTGGADGGYPLAGPTLGTDGNIYGTTANGGNSVVCFSGIAGCGTIFKFTTAGRLTTLYTFDSTHGAYPESSLTLRTDGKFYGNTLSGGLYGQGVFYSLSTGLQPFISLVTTSGKAGSKVGILGQGFSHSSIVKFGGVQATTITVTGTTYISATVPAGAISGNVTVTTGTTTLTSAQKFIVHDSWSTGAPIPTAVQGAASGTINNKIYVVGGATSNTIVANTQVYNPTTNTWTTGASLPTARFAAAGAVVSNILYVIGGNPNGSSQTNVVEAYNPTTNTWSTKAPMPTSRDSITAVVQGGIIYVIGGFNSSGRLTTVESYNPTTNVWTPEAPLLVGKSGAAAGLLGSTIVAAGGLTNSAVTGDNEGYNSATNSWSSLTADPTARQTSCSASVLGLLYVAGGSNGTALNLNESYNNTAHKWTTLTSMPQAVVFPASATASNLLYCIGGSSSGAFGQGTVYNNLQIYQP